MTPAPPSSSLPARRGWGSTGTTLTAADLAGRVALVTGASGGLGAHFGRVLARHGAAVALTVDVNLLGAFRVARAVARRLVEAGRPGSVVNAASILAYTSLSVAAYAASKAGLVQLTRSLALERARRGIRVNALAPGYVRADINRGFFAGEARKAMVRRVPQRRLGEPEDLDRVLLLLASDASRYMTGAVITVDGGHLCAGL